MRKTLREEILSVNIKKDNTYDEICTDPQKLDLKNLIFGGRFSFGKI